MPIVNTHEAKTQLSRILAEVERGEEYIIARAGHPVARLVPVSPHSEGATPGLWRGQVTIAPDFDGPSPEIEALFDGHGV
jgi:prevent-host-death family protein